MAKKFQTDEVNRFLSKFNIPVKSADECSPLVQEWAQRFRASDDYFRPMQTNLINDLNKTIAELDRQIETGQTPHIGGMDFVADQRRILDNARRNMMAEPNAAREVHEMFVAGVQAAHSQIPAKERSFSQPAIRVWESMPDPKQTPLLIELKFVQTARNVPGKGKEYFIAMHPNAIITWAANKERMKSLAPEERKKEMEQLAAYYIHAGSEEYYHVYQDANPAKASRIHKDSIKHYGTEHYDASRKRIEDELAGLGRSNPEEFARRNAEYHRTDPAEKDAGNAMQRLAPVHAAMASAYIAQRQRGGPA